MSKGNKTTVWGKNTTTNGVHPSIALIDPKFAHNVGRVIRLASCYGMKQVWFTGDRVKLDPDKGERLPREERMKGYQEVQLINYDYIFERFPRDVVPVAIEVRRNSEPLFAFEHPEKALYVFGPEDGSIPQVMLRHCQRFVVIPTRHCLNLATAVSTVLWDRELKRFQRGEITTPITPGEFENRGLDRDLAALFGDDA